MAWYNLFWPSDPITPEPSAAIPVPDTVMFAAPISINPGRPQQLARHVGRLANLYNVKERGDKRKEIGEEINMRKSAISSYGHTPPKTEAEARLLFSKLEGA